jgi:anti-anti-sigma factor
MHVPTAKPDGSFTISSRRLDHGILIAPGGELDLATVPVVEEELRRAEQSEDLIVLDLGDVTFMDSTGIRMVIAADQRLRSHDASLRIVHVPPHVSRLFELAGIASHLAIGDWVDIPPEPIDRT